MVGGGRSLLNDTAFLNETFTVLAEEVKNGSAPPTIGFVNQTSRTTVNLSNTTITYFNATNGP